MGRGKPEPNAEAEANNKESLDGSITCGICGELVDKEEEYLRVFCNKCDECHLHMECGVEFLIARANEKSNSIAVSKYKVKARKQPVHIFEQRMPCPNGIFTLESDKGKQWGSQACRGKHTATGACPGFTIGAELIKPAKEPPAPLPQVMPARAPKEKKKEAKLAGAAPPKRTLSSASSTSTTSHLSTASTKMRAAPGAAAPGSGASVRLLGTSHSPWTTVGGAGGGGSFKKQSVPGAAPPPDRLRLPPGVSRPAELTLCKHFLDGGSCYMYRCEFAHSEEELQQREKAWVARQESKKKEAARREAVAQAAAAARLEEEQEVLAQLASMELLHDNGLPAPYTRSATPASALPPSVAAAPAAGLPLSDRCLALMRSFKRSICLNSLLEMGFPSAQAGAATDAAGGDLERAAQMLMDGQPCGAALPTDVTREAEELASVAMALGKSADAVEDHLVMTGGNWEAASEAMQAPAGANSSSFGDSTAVPEDLASWAPSEPDTPSAGAPAAAPWATDASSSLSAPSPYSQSPRAAAALPAAATGGLPPVPAAARGVLSLADFSDGPGLDAGLHHVAGPTEQAAAGAAALPTLLGLAASAPDTGGFSDGYAAGLAAAAAMYNQQQYAVQPPSQFDAASLGGVPSFAAPLPTAHDASYWGTVPPAQAAANGAGDEEELDELLNLLGVGA